MLVNVFQNEYSKGDSLQQTLEAPKRTELVNCERNRKRLQRGRRREENSEQKMLQLKRLQT